MLFLGIGHTCDVVDSQLAGSPEKSRRARDQAQLGLDDVVSIG